MLTRVETTLAAIKTKLLNDEIIRKLLFNDSNNALNMDTPTKEQVDKYITLYPIFEFENKEDYAQNSMINIYLSDMAQGDELNIFDGTFRISILVNIDRWSLVDNKIRPIQIASRIMSLLNDKKFSISNPINLNEVQNLIVSKKLVGYTLLYDFVDGNSNLEKF